ncbi:MAG: TIGR01620 family protein [Hyphomicrobiaceae bacterium]|nr:TIGR01620 family protein [Hyphomicrobiaceae bacterium]
MNSPAETRQPRAFDPSDVSLIEEPLTDPEPQAVAKEPTQPTADTQGLARPTLTDLTARGLRWGAVLISALAGAAALGASAWFARLVAAALVREDWIGWTTLALLLAAGLAGLMIILREVIGFAQLARLSRIRSEVAKALAEGDADRERSAALRLAGLYARRPQQAWSVRRFREHARDVHDAGELLALAEREMVAPLDHVARRSITRSAKRVATVTAMSPMALIAVSFVLIENLRLLRTLAAIYGGRPGFFGLMRLAHLVLAHLLATGGVALTDDLLGQFLGQDLLRRLSRRLGEGAFNGALTARIGIAAIAITRPLPFRAVKPPRVRDVLGEVLKPIFSANKS